MVFLRSFTLTNSKQSTSTPIKNSKQGGFALFLHQKGMANMESETMRELIKKLLDSDVSAYRIGKEADIATAIILNLRNGKRDVDNISLATAEKMAAYQQKIDNA